MAHAPDTKPVVAPFGVAEGKPDASAANANVHNNGDVFFLAGGDWPKAGNSIPVIHIGPDRPILLPMVNVVDTEGPGIPQSIGKFVESGRGSYADEANLVTHLSEQQIVEAHLTVKRVGETKPIIDIHGNDSLKYTIDTGTFALGKPQPHDYVSSVIGNDPSLKNLPFSSEIGRWAMLELTPGDYIVNFGGTGNPVFDPVTKAGIFPQGFQHDTTVQLHIDGSPHHW
jgi:hypothetical protein